MLAHLPGPGPPPLSTKGEDRMCDPTDHRARRVLVPSPVRVIRRAGGRRPPDLPRPVRQDLHGWGAYAVVELGQLPRSQATTPQLAPDQAEPATYRALAILARLDIPTLLASVDEIHGRHAQARDTGPAPFRAPWWIPLDSVGDLLRNRADDTRDPAGHRTTIVVIRHGAMSGYALLKPEPGQ